MLDQTQYNNLWTNTFGLPIQQIPCFYQYLQREVYFQDYLDLFGCPNSGNPTFVRDKHMSVYPGFRIPHNPAYTVQQGNQVRLIVDYDFPYAGQLCKNREIKYILIGEAAHPSSKTYFYNINHTAYTPYLKAPLDAWGVNAPTKLDKLIGLANQGVILLDLFPFALSYNTNFRDRLNKSGVTNSFWDNAMNAYSIKIRINTALAAYLHNDWDLAFVAPCKISEHIVNPQNGFQPLTMPNIGLHPVQFRSQNKNKTRCNLGAQWRKVTVSSAGSPTQQLIQAAF